MMKWLSLVVLVALTSWANADTAAVRLRREWVRLSAHAGERRWNAITRVLCRELGNRGPGAAAHRLRSLVERAFAKPGRPYLLFGDPGRPIAVFGKRPGVVARVDFEAGRPHSQHYDSDCRLIWFYRQKGRWRSTVLEDEGDATLGGHEANRRHHRERSARPRRAVSRVG